VTKGYECDKCVGHVVVYMRVTYWAWSFDPALLLTKQVMRDYYIDMSPFVCVCARARGIHEICCIY